MRRRLFLGLPLLALLPAMAERAPRMRIKSVNQLPQPLPAPYDRRADADAQIDAALVRARASGKPLLIDFGANWCADCRVLAGVLALPELSAWVARNFELVQVDIGEFDRNMNVALRFRRTELDAVPSVFVVDAKTGKLRNAGHELGLGDARVMRPQAIADWLAKWP